MKCSEDKICENYSRVIKSRMEINRGIMGKIQRRELVLSGLVSRMKD